MQWKVESLSPWCDITNSHIFDTVWPPLQSARTLEKIHVLLFLAERPASNKTAMLVYHQDTASTSESPPLINRYICSSVVNDLKAQATTFKKSPSMYVYLCVKGAMQDEHMRTMESATSNSNGTDQTSQMCMMVCAFVVSIWLTAAAYVSWIHVRFGFWGTKLCSREDG